MAKNQQRNMEGDADQKRAAARDAKAQGKRPSEMSATTGASKQRESADANASHQEKLDQKHEGKLGRRSAAGRDAPKGPRPPAVEPSVKGRANRPAWICPRFPGFHR